MSQSTWLRTFLSDLAQNRILRNLFCSNATLLHLSLFSMISPKLLHTSPFSPHLLLICPFFFALPHSSIYPRFPPFSSPIKAALTCRPVLCSGSCCISPDSSLVCLQGCGPLPPALCMCNPRFDPDSSEPPPCPCWTPPACAGPCAARPSGSWGPLRPWADPQPLHPGLGRP